VLRVERSLRLPDGEFFPASRKKTGIAIHHTVGGTAYSTLEHWLRDRTKAGKRRVVGTAYIVDRDGTVFEVFQPLAWAFQFGLEWPPARQLKFEQRFIGIELASEGGLTECDGHLYCFDRVSSKTRKPCDESFDYGKPYRGYRYFDKYEHAQVDSLVTLINHLCDTYTIKRQVPYPPFDYYGERLVDFKGIIGHAMVSADNTDPAPVVSLWERLIRDCRLTKATIPSPPEPVVPRLTDSERDRLFESNIDQVSTLSVAAGSLVKGLILELERRDTYIRLFYAEPGGHRVEYEFLTGRKEEYEFLTGRKELVKRLATAFGFQRVTESLLEVRRG
jgi:hypothetical protein